MVNKDIDPVLQKTLQLIWVKLEERFKSFSQAFIFFDVNTNNRLSFNDFQKGLETLKVKVTKQGILNCWHYLNPN